MSTQMSKSAFKELIQENINFLMRYCPATLERLHIVNVLNDYVDKLYPKISNHKITPEYLVEKGFSCMPWGYVKNEILIRTNHKDKFWIELGNGKRIELDSVDKLQLLYKLAGCPVF